jgi:hypothetical protein
MTPKDELRLAEQQRKWERDLAGARGGNPYATLCLHCYGRHAPPRDEMCPHESIEALRTRITGDDKP